MFPLACINVFIYSAFTLHCWPCTVSTGSIGIAFSTSICLSANIKLNLSSNTWVEYLTPLIPAGHTDPERGLLTRPAHFSLAHFDSLILQVILSIKCNTPKCLSGTPCSPTEIVFFCPPAYPAVCLCFVTLTVGNGHTVLHKVRCILRF